MLAVFILHLTVLLMTYLNSGRFDKEEEAVAIANAADVGLAGECLSPATTVNARFCLLSITLECVCVFFCH